VWDLDKPGIGIGLGGRENGRREIDFDSFLKST
jgi:hypothetical protein